MTAEREGLAEALTALADEFASNVDWSAGRNNYGDNEAWESAARQVRDLADALADLLAARDRRVRGEALMQAEGDIRDYRAAYSRCVDLSEEWQALDFEPATQADLSTLTTINRCGRELARALEADE